MKRLNTLPAECAIVTLFLFQLSFQILWAQEEKLPGLSFAGSAATASLTIDIHSGDILSIYDPDELLDREFPIGSLAKIFTVIAGLEDGSLNTESSVFCGATAPEAPELDSCWYHPGHGALRLTDAIAVSCNKYFIEMAGFIDYESFIGAALAFRIIDAAPEAASDYGIRIKRMVGLTTDIRSSPKNMLRAAAAIFNGGRFHDAASKIENGDSRAPSITISANTLDVLKTGMRGSILRGTSAGAARTAGTDNILGKTGTAKYLVDGKRDSTKTHGWWIGLYPANEPAVAVVVFVIEGSGAADAAPLGGRIIAEYIRQRGTETFSIEDK